MKVSARAAAAGICAAISFGLMAPALSADVIVRPTSTVQVVDMVNAQDVVYTPMRNEVITRVPAGTAIVPGLDTLKLQVQNGIASGLASGNLVEDEALQVQEALDGVERQEAVFKLEGLTPGHVNNLSRKYAMIATQLDDLLTNPIRNNFMPNFEMRREAMMRRILYHMAAANLSPGEGEQLLSSLNQISDNYNIARATGGVLSADELEASHKDLLALHGKLVARTSGTIAFVVPETIPERQEYLNKIQAGIASKLLTPAEGKKLIEGYNQLVYLENSMVVTDGPRSEAIRNLAKEINSLRFVLDRQLKDRAGAAPSSAVAGSSNKM